MRQGLPSNRSVPHRLIRGLRFALLGLAVLTAGHDSLYLATYGVRDYHHALASTGHGVPWTGICLAGILGAVAVALVAVQRSRRLNRRLRQLGAPPLRTARIGPLGRRIVGLWLPLLATVLLVFTVQENLEHVTNHGGHFPALDVLYLGEYQWTIPIFAVVALAAAAIGTVTIEHLRVLAEAVGHWEARAARRARVLMPNRRHLGFRQTHIGQPYRGRAPPRIRSLVHSS